MKPRYVLVPPHALRAVARVLTKSADAKGDFGWHKIARTDEGRKMLIDKAMRHLEEVRLGVERDEETGESPLAHATSNLLFLLEWIEGGL